jgi:hypothetical protein
MKMLAPVLPVVLNLAFAAAAAAGIVVDEQQMVDQLNGTRLTRARTVMIEGDKQKAIIDNGKRTVITDLGKGTMMMVDGMNKTYAEIPFPPQGGATAAILGGGSPTISFKKTGGHNKIIGYSCDEYSGAGIIGGNSVTMSGCFSESAPGAADYTNFQLQMNDKVKGTTMANMGQMPAGVPLRLTITTIISHIPTAGMTAQQANNLNQMLAHRHFVTDTTVSKITTKSLPPDSFQVPPNYEKQPLPPMFGGTSKGAPITPATPHKVPE